MLACSCGKIISLTEVKVCVWHGGGATGFDRAGKNHGWGRAVKVSCIFNVFRWTDNDVSHNKERFAALTIPFCNSLLIFLLINCTKRSFQKRDLPSKLSEFVAERSGVQLAPSKQSSSVIFPPSLLSQTTFWLKIYHSSKCSAVPKYEVSLVGSVVHQNLQLKPLCCIFPFAVTLELLVSLSE